MQTLEMEIIPPKESPQVTRFDEKLAPLKERRAALDAKWSECCSLVNPYNNAPATERARVEAELAIPRMREDFKRINLDIEDLERERDQALKAEQAQVEAARLAAMTWRRCPCSCPEVMSLLAITLAQ